MHVHAHFDVGGFANAWEIHTGEKIKSTYLNIRKSLVISLALGLLKAFEGIS